ncbi:sporulation histidine kinase inhibitor Sda [Paenibacillus oenotherae]|uniref:sporulation histidine kinase inhibitor Sda n=1 Tax=Paenibacillus oenotherae TaxID=1435645 RepID=UPI001FE9CE9A|nr:sporulation histidine kinase inhibitor Sda [Paenibacillus oenotherae]
MKLSNPFASVRNFIRSSEPGRKFTPYAPVYEQPFERHTNDHEETQQLFLPMQDKSLLLRPLSDTHLIEVYHEAKAMRLSEEFIALIEQAINQRGLSANNDFECNSLPN